MHLLECYLLNCYKLENISHTPTEISKKGIETPKRKGVHFIYALSGMYDKAIVNVYYDA